jgi:hypothetical protein
VSAGLFKARRVNDVVLDRPSLGLTRNVTLNLITDLLAYVGQGKVSKDSKEPAQV